MNIKKLFAPSDMTTGRPWEKIVSFMIPMLLGNIAQQLYSTVDSIIVGKYVGDNALAAVGSAMPIMNLLLVLFIGISVGAGVMVSQYFGAKRREELSKAIGNSLALTMLASAAIMLIGSLSARPILHLLNTPDTIIDWSADYLITIFLGMAGFAFYNILTGVLRGLGDSISALVFLLIATVLNIGLDIWFVASFGLGVFGVALATIIAQAISALLCFLKLRGMRDVFDMKLAYLKPEKQFALGIVRLGLPSGLTQAIFSLSMVVVQALTNSFGELVIAANVIIMRVDGFAMMPNFSFGTALTTYAGQNVGAKRLDRVEQGARSGTWIAIITSAVITGLIVLFGPWLMSIFTNTQELIDMSASMMRILAVGYIAMAITQSLSGIMRGAGDTMTPMWISLITTVAVRVPLAYLLVYLSKTPELPDGHYSGIFISLLICWLIGAVLTFIAYKRGRWKEKGLD